MSGGRRGPNEALRSQSAFHNGFAESAALANSHRDPGMQMVAKPFVMAAFANKVAEMIEV